MSQPLPPWSLHWSTDGELSPMDRADLAPLFLGLPCPGANPWARGILTAGVAGQGPIKPTVQGLLFPYR